MKEIRGRRELCQGSYPLRGCLHLPGKVEKRREKCKGGEGKSTWQKKVGGKEINVLGGNKNPLTEMTQRSTRRGVRAVLLGGRGGDERAAVEGKKEGWEYWGAEQYWYPGFGCRGKLGTLQKNLGLMLGKEEKTGVA